MFAAPPAVPVLVALVEAAVVVAAVSVVLALPLAVLEQTTTVGRVVTPRPPQNTDAKLTATDWSDGPQFLERQHEMSSMKSLLPQMHFESLPHSPMPPWRKGSTHVCAQEGICATAPVARARDKRVAENFILRMLWDGEIERCR